MEKVNLIRTRLGPGDLRRLAVLLADIPGITADDFEIIFYNEDHKNGYDTYLGILCNDNPAWSFAVMQMGSIDEGYNRMNEKIKAEFNKIIEG